MSLKKSVLEILLSSLGGFVSGESMSTHLGKSRMAIHNAISSLRDDGFEIEASTKNGYSLKSTQDAFTEDYLELSFKGTGIKTFFLNEIDSTNNEAKRLLTKGERAPLLLVAETQFGGRGRMGRSFFSPKGGLYFTLVLPGDSVKDSDLITTAASLGVLRAIEKTTGKKCSIKWVNDVYLDGKKIVGILTEGSYSMESGLFDSFIIGIGINLRVKESEFPDSLKDIAGSIYPNGEGSLSRMDLLKEAVKSVIAVIDEDFIEEYKRECFLIGKRIYRLKGGEYREALALDIDSKGHLIVEYEDGERDTLSSGEVKILLKKRSEGDVYA